MLDAGGREGVPPGLDARRRRVTRALVPAVLLLAGLLLAASAVAARGTGVPANHDQLPERVAAEQRSVSALSARADRLRAEVALATRVAAAGDPRVRIARQSAAALSVPLGLTAVTGPGLLVALDDAPAQGGRRLPPGIRAPGPDDLVVHQQDLQSVVNGLWAGGGEAMSVMGQRVTATTAIRCVGNTLLLAGRVYSPPFVVRAIGSPQELEAALDAAPGVQIFRQYVAAYGLGLSLKREIMTLPAVGAVPRLRAAGPLGP